ncbi:MAG: tetratricopeptide repeat protein [Candidatus Moranbacteria bacterium]|nr:tetratricopeptide repeat protein [Candidatus Moranbacteria bacterium]
MLWYLVLPPFIVILSLGVLLWYLSRRMNDEEISKKLSIAKAEAMSESHSRSLHRKAFFLKMLEKAASRFKTGTLRIHNFFQHSLERLRKRRNEIDAIRRHIDDDKIKEEPKETAIIPENTESAVQKKPRFLSSLRPKVTESALKEQSEYTAVETPVVTQSDEPVIPSARPRPWSRISQRVREGVEPQEEMPVPRPMLRREVVTPDAMPEGRGRGGKDPHEVALLSRIVENPRDSSAYEELGDWYFASRSMQDAKECYRQALKLHPTNRAVKIKIRRLEKFFEGRES